MKPQLVRHTAESSADLHALAKRWKNENHTEVVRKALRVAMEQGPAQD